MIIACAGCHARLRLPRAPSGSRLLTVRCPQCATLMKVREAAERLPKVLIAHDDPKVSVQLQARLRLLDLSIRWCSNSHDILENTTDSPCLLLLDVGFEERFPFDLIAEVKKQTAHVHRILLLPSVYKKTAYKKQPDYLYGADGYLELHHIGDRLLPLVAEFYPQLQSKIELVSSVSTDGGERFLPGVDNRKQLETQARLLVADMVLYQYREVLKALTSGCMSETMQGYLEEGRRMLTGHATAAGSQEDDLLGRAFKEVCDFYAQCQRLELQR